VPVITRPDSDVDRALQAFGGPALRYRSFAPSPVCQPPAAAPLPDDVAPVDRPLLIAARAPPLSALETAFVLELPAAPPAFRQPPVPAGVGAKSRVAPLADLFRTLGQPRDTVAPS
jgi:hypothetical protein